MSEFMTIVPVQAEPTDAPVLFLEPPAWVNASQLVLGCIPLVLLLLYWAKKVRCEKLVGVTVWTCLASVAIFMGWLFGSGAYRQLA